MKHFFSIITIIILTIMNISLYCASTIKSKIITELTTHIELFPNENMILDSYYSDIPDALQVYEALIYFEIPCPDVVVAQAQLETGHFRMIPNNNLFGMYRGTKLMKFDHWMESIVTYKRFISQRYNGNSDDTEAYLIFLENIGYAESKDYNRMLNQIIKSNEYGQWYNSFQHN